MRALLVACIALAADVAQTARVNDLFVAHEKGVFTVRGSFVINAAPVACRLSRTT